MADPAMLQTWLEQAEAARHALLTGQSTIRLQHGGKEMAFQRADLSALVQYIGELRALLGLTPLPMNYGRARRMSVGG